MRHKTLIVLASAVIAAVVPSSASAGTPPEPPADLTVARVPPDTPVSDISTDATADVSTDGSGTVDDATPDPGAPVSPHDELTQRYTSLTSTMLSSWAQSSGETLDSYLSERSAEAATFFGLHGDGLPALPAADPVSVDATLASNGITLNPVKMASFGELTSRLSAGNLNADLAVVAAGASWANELGKLRTPTLDAPATPATDPQFEIAAGLLLNRTLTAFVTDHPSLFADGAVAGLTNPQAQAAWKSSLLAAWSDSRGDLSRMLPAPCVGVMLEVAATGQPAPSQTMSGSARACSPCVAGGLYLHSQFQRALDPSSNTVLPTPGDGVINPADWSNLSTWQQQVLIDQSPALSDRLSDGLGGGPAGGCSTMAPATSSTLNQTLPGVFKNLQR